MSQFDATSTTDDVIAGISLAGKLAVVTGASSGLGVETARTLAGAGAEVLLVARDMGKLDGVLAQLREAVPSGVFYTCKMDLADLGSVRDAAADILAAHPSINLLLNNAGVMACPMLRTAQGHELQFGTNHLGHFLFTCLLAPALVAGAPARVVNLSSAGHKFADFNFDDPDYKTRDYEKWQAYGESKTANALFNVGLDARLRQKGVRTFAVHPGVIMTELSRHMDEADYATLSERSPPGEELVFKSVEQGSATSVWAATSPELADKGGIYLENCQIATSAVQGSSSGVESYALDSTASERLWALSEQMAGQSFDL